MILSKETMAIGILAVLSGLGVAYGVRSYLQRQEPAPVAAPVVKGPPMTRLPIATSDLPADRVITLGDVGILSMTTQRFFERCKGMEVNQVITLSKDIIGRRLKAPVKQGQPFLTTGLYLEGTGPSIAEKLRPGFRAVPLSVPDGRESGVVIGAMVDVVFRVQPRGERDGQPAIPETTVTLLKQLEVLDVDRSAAGRTADKKILVTLAVPVDKADVLSAVDGRGELWLVALPAGGPEDKTLPIDKVTLSKLLDIQPPVQTAIYRRNKLQVNKFVMDQLVGTTGDVGAPAPDASKDRPAAAPATPPPAGEPRDQPDGSESPATVAPSTTPDVPSTPVPKARILPPVLPGVSR